MTIARTVVVADDDADVLALLSFHLRQWGFRVQTAANKGELLEAFRCQAHSALILDLQFGDHDGIEILTQLSQQGVQTQTVFLTGCGTIDHAVQAIKLGAIDFLTKPPDLLRLRQLLEHIVGAGTRDKKRTKPEGERDLIGDESAIIGDSDAVRRLRSLIADVAKTDAKALILGETGTGKELVARELHRCGRRAAGPFLPVNMAALPETLAEGVLFGHRKGAFTGADADQVGCCEAAHNGTLFLDEIGEMPLLLQAKLLRFLQGNSFQRLGSVETISVDVRVLAATNLTSQQLLEGGRLREDLYYRLNVVPIEVPPLRERTGDASLLAQRFLDNRRESIGGRVMSFAAETLAAIDDYHWPGNIRQLEGLIERLTITCRSEIIGVTDLPPEMNRSGISQPNNSVSPVDAKPLPKPETSPLMPMERLQKQAIQEALDQVGGNVVMAANLLGVGQATVYRKMKRFGIVLPSVQARVYPPKMPTLIAH